MTSSGASVEDEDLLKFLRLIDRDPDMTPAERLAAYHRVQQEAEGIFLERNTEYKSSFELHGVYGIAVEIVSLAGRLVALVLHRPDAGEAKREKVLNVFLDLINFANFGAMLIYDDNWKGNTNEDPIEE